MSTNTTDHYGARAPEHNEMDLLRFFGEIIDHRALILSITLLFTLGAVLFAFMSTPVYQGDVLIQVESKQDNNLLKSLSQFSGDLTPDTGPEILLLKSRMILGATVDQLKLAQQVKPQYFPVLGKFWAQLKGRTPPEITLKWLNIPLLNGKLQKLILTVLENGRYRLEGDNVDAEGMTGKPFALNGISLFVTDISASTGDTFELKTSSRLEAINALNKRLTVAESAKQSGMLTLTLTGEKPEKIIQILDTVADNYLKQNIARQEAQDTRSLAFLQNQLPKISHELDLAEARLNAYREKSDSVDLSLEAKSVLDQVVNVENQLNELTFREVEISQLFKKEHPTYRALREKRQTLQQERTRLNNRVSAMPSTQQEILRLSRDVESGRTIYLQLLTRQQELNISRSSVIGNVRIIDQAVTQPDPVWPKKVPFVVIGIMTGLMLSTGSVLFRLGMQRGITTSEQLEAKGIPVLATLPRSVWLWKKTHLRRKNLFASQWLHKTSEIPFLPIDRPTDIFVEAIRGLRTSLHFTMMDVENQTVVITGPTPDCGKTLVSTSLAAVAAQAGLRVLFIDADMRKGYVHNILGLSNQTGLSSVLEGKSEYWDAVQSYAKGGIDVMTCGPVPSAPSELLLGHTFREMMSWVNENYDLIILDTPPVLAVTDAALIARYAATSVLVARYHKTSEKEIENSIKRLLQAGVQVRGTILNDIMKSAALYYSSGYSQQGYGYTQRNKHES